MRLSIGAALAVLTVGALLCATPCLAADVARAESELTQTQAAALVQQRYAARVLRASSVDEGGRHIYIFRLLSQAGKVWEVRVDARSGMEVR